MGLVSQSSMPAHGVQSTDDPHCLHARELSSGIAVKILSEADQSRLPRHRSMLSAMAPAISVATSGHGTTSQMPAVTSESAAISVPHGAASTIGTSGTVA